MKTVSTLLLVGALATVPTLGHAADTTWALTSAAVSGLGARNIGSAAMSGRIAALAARVEKDGKVTVFVGAASGGVWKSQDGGTTFKPVFDKQKVQSIGAIALDPTDKDVVWVGSGEAWTRNSVSIGDGVYKSTNGGETWTNMGLPQAERIAKILVHPKDGKTVYVCVPGKLWSDSADRGLYKTVDGGKTWALILKGANLSTGCATLAMDPTDPNRLIAGLWDFRRKGWTFRSGGEGPDQPSGSALMTSGDGGATWASLDAKTAKGLPAGPWGRTAVAFAPSNPRIVYAFIEGTRSALFRSDDGGRTWEERDRSQSMVWRPFYFAALFVDPKNPDRIFKPDLSLIASEDGGKSFSNVSGGTHGDHHALWINPTNTKHIITGDDGGLWISHDGGNTWLKCNNLPVSQFYHVSVDNKDPYQVYGGLQDNSSWVGDSAYPGGITNGRWENLFGGDGFWTFADPSDPDFAYAEAQGGEIGRINRKTLSQRQIQPKAGYQEKLRYNWNTPIHLSPNEKGTIYIGAQFLFRSRDHGQSWDRISPDLTTNDPDKQKQEQSGGITVDNSAAEMHTTIYSISESPKNGKVIWIGTDDGNLQLTQDGGQTWTNVVGAVPDLPKASWVAWVEASRFDPASAYAVFDRHSFGDMTAHVYKTTDFGKTWTPVVSPAQTGDGGIRGYAHVIKEDPVKPNILFLGTEFGLWITIDGGAHWAEFKGGNFPAVAVRDIAIQERDNDLVLATHGRGFWIIDDISPLRQLSDQVLSANAALLAGRPPQLRIEGNGGWPEGDGAFKGVNPANGVVITYYQKSRHIFGKLKIEILDQSGKVLDTLSASTRPGLNRVVWSARLNAPRVPPAAQVAFNSAFGPRVLPGTYKVRLTKGDQVLTSDFTIVKDPRNPASDEDLRAHFDALIKVRALFRDMSDMVARLNAIRGQADAAAQAMKPGDALQGQLRDLSSKADRIRGNIVATKEGGAITGEERLREYMDRLYGALASDKSKPTAQDLARLDALSREQADIAKDIDNLVATDLAGANGALASRGLKEIALPPRSSAEGAGSGGGSIKPLEGWRFSLRGQGAAPRQEERAERD